MMTLSTGKQGETIVAFDKASYDMQYAKDKLKRVPLNIHKDYFTEVLQKLPEKTGMTVQGFIKAAINEKIKRDGIDLPFDQYKP